MAKLRNKTFRRNSKRRISKKNTKKSKSRRRFRKFGGGYGDDDDRTLNMVVNKLQARRNNIIKLSKDNKGYVESWGKNLTLPVIEQNSRNQSISAIQSHNQIINELINGMKAKDQDIDAIALVIYGDESPESIQKIQDVISQNVMSTM
jgi:hypothetical protein